MWTEQRSQHRRVYWRNHNDTGPKRSFEPFAPREQAEAFIKLARDGSRLAARRGALRPSLGEVHGRASGRLVAPPTSLIHLG